MLRGLNFNPRWNFLFIVICFFSCNGLDTNTKNKDIQKREITNTEIEIYEKCIDLVLTSSTFKTINNKIQKKYKIDSVFSTSAINNFQNEIRGDSIYKTEFIESEIKGIDHFINGQSINDTGLLKLDTLIDSHDRNVLISFSKPNDKYITVFVQSLEKFGSTYKTSEQIQGNILFLLENNEILKYHERTAIFEVY